MVEQERRARIRKLRAEARKIELKNAEAEGRMVDRDDVVHESAYLCSTLRSRIQGLPDYVMSEIPETLRPLAQSALENAARLFLRELAATHWEPLGEASEDLILEAADAIRRRRQQEGKGDGS